MELSISIPIARASPAIDIIFNVVPAIFITKNVIIIDTGIDIDAIKELIKCLKKKSITKKAKIKA
jgi:glyoxylase-like metal-dependent hydrolase (beta-lactamase superfamily II)